MSFYPEEPAQDENLQKQVYFKHLRDPISYSITRLLQLQQKDNPQKEKKKKDPNVAIGKTESPSSTKKVEKEY